MKLQTTRFGEIEINEKIFRFHDGIPGFEHLNEFTFVSDEENAPFSYLQSVEDGGVAFIVINPFEIFPQYDFHLPEFVVEELSLESVEQICILSIVTIREDLESATTNLVAPIVINLDSGIGKQVILTNTDYTVRHRLFAPESAK